MAANARRRWVPTAREPMRAPATGATASSICSSSCGFRVKCSAWICMIIPGGATGRLSSLPRFAAASARAKEFRCKFGRLRARRFDVTLQVTNFMATSLHPRPSTLQRALNRLLAAPQPRSPIPDLPELLVHKRNTRVRGDGERSRWPSIATWFPHVFPAEPLRCPVSRLRRFTSPDYSRI